MSSSLTSPSVVLRDIEKTYRVTRDGEEVALSRNKKITVKALKPMSLAVYAGESVGVLGANGSGKSTLMTLIAGNEEPTGGQLLVSAKPTLLSVSAALQSHLTGLQNVRMGLLAKGMPLNKVKDIELEVAEWAEIGDAIHRPLKTYSSGMGARLRFAISTAVQPDILLIDEALATGDATFNAKAAKRMASFLDNAATVFHVTHSIQQIRAQCTRAIWLHDGELIANGSTDDVTRFYRKWSKLVEDGDRKTSAQMIRRMKRDFVPEKIVLDSEAAKLWDETYSPGESGWGLFRRKKRG